MPNLSGIPNVNEFPEGPGFERPEHLGLETTQESTKKIFDSWEKQTEVPRRTVVVDGREVIIIGDVEKFKEYNHEQGQNEFGFQGTCGLVACEDILKQFGIKVTENDLVKFGIKNHFWDDKKLPPESMGGTTVDQQLAILEHFGVKAISEKPLSMEELASRFESGKAVKISVSAERLWDQPVPPFARLQSNHAIIVTGVQRDAKTGKIDGFFINDSGNFDDGRGSGRFVDANKFKKMWVDVGGSAITTVQSVPR